MVTFRNNNNRRNNFRRTERGYKQSNERQKFSSTFSNNDNFKRKSPGRNNHNAAKLIEKYNDLAREALAHEDKILSENYFQHADHFTRVLSEQEKNQSSKTINNFDKNLSKVISDENKKNNSDTNEKLEGKVISS